MRTWPLKQLQEFLGDRAILVVEPAINYRTSIKQFLTNLKIANIIVASNVEEARREMLTQKIGLFVVEWSLNEINGLQFCRELRKEIVYENTPFLLLSVENLQRDVILASEVKIDGYLLKPFSYEDFCQQIFMILRNHTTPSRMNNLIDLGHDRIKRGDLEAAHRLFVQALTLKPNSARAICGMALCKKMRGEVNDAVELLLDATRANESYLDAYRMLLDISEERGDYDSIKEYAAKLHDLSPDNPRYTLLLAHVHLRKQELTESEAFFRKTVALSPRLATAYKGLGEVYVCQEEYEKAMRNFNKALDLDRDDISTLNSLGLTYVRLGEFKKGINHYQMALKLNPNDARILFNLGHAYEKMNRPDKAKWYYAQSLLHKAGYDRAMRGLERLGQGRQLKSTQKDEFDQEIENDPFVDPFKDAG